MGSTVKFEVSAEVANAVNAVLKVVSATGKVADGWNKAGAASDRAGRKMEQGAQAAVKRIRASTGSGHLRLSQTERQALNAGSVISGSSTFSTAIERRYLAQSVREQRRVESAARWQNTRNMVFGGANLARMDLRMSEIGARHAAAATARSAAAESAADARHTAAFNTGNVAAYGSIAGRMPGEDAFDAKARRDVTRRVSGMRELDGKVSPDDMRNMVASRSAQMRRQSQFNQSAATGILGVGVAAVGYANKIDQELSRYADEISGFSRQMAPLAGVGDNQERRRQISQEVLAYSGGLGVDRGEVIAARTNIEASASDLPAAVRDALLKGAASFYKLQGSDMRLTGSALNSSVQLVGKELAPGAKGVQEMTNKLAYAADVGSFNVDEVTPYLGGVLSSFKGMGYKHEDALASLIIGSKSGARPEQYSTAIRNLPLLMSEGEKKLGHKLSPDFGTAMGQLGQLKSTELLDLVGRDTFAAAKAIADNADEFKRHSEALKKLTGNMDVIGGKLAKAWADPGYAAGQYIDSARQLQQNAPIIQAEQMPWMTQAATNFEVTKAGAALNSNPLLSWFDKPAAWIEAAGGAMGFSDLPLKRVGLEKMISDYKQSGQTTAAATLELTHGETLDTYWKDKKGKKHYSDESDARAVAALAAKGTVLSAGQYEKYEELKDWQGEGAANKYLAGFKGKKTPAGAKGPQGAAQLINQAGQLIMQAGQMVGAPGGPPAPKNPQTHTD